MRMPAKRCFVLLCAMSAAACSSADQNAAAKRLQTPLVPTANTITAHEEGSLYLNVIDGLLKQERYGAALAFLDGYMTRERNPEPRYWLLRGNALLGLNRPAEAQPAFARLEQTELSGEGWNGRGRVAASRFMWKEASANFRRAVQASPANADFLNNLAFAEMRMGQSGSAVMHLRQAHELQPQAERIRNNLVIALTLSGNRAGAEEILSRIVDDTKRHEVRAIVQAATIQFTENRS